MKDFAAIDFETANFARSSICSAGVVIVRNHKIKEQKLWLIRPSPNYYKNMNTRIHGLSRKDTDTAPPFPLVWKEVMPLIRDLPLVAHNSTFDEGCLKAAFDVYDMQYPDYKFYCTLKQARAVLKDQLPDFKLPTVASYLGFELKRHHEALSDALACAHIAIKLFG